MEAGLLPYAKTVSESVIPTTFFLGYISPPLAPLSSFSLHHPRKKLITCQLLDAAKPGLHIPCVQVCRVMSKTKALAHPLIRVGSRQQIVYPQKLKGDLKKFRAHYLARHFEDMQ
jgi:hypothetical protein